MSLSEQPSPESSLPSIPAMLASLKLPDDGLFLALQKPKIGDLQPIDQRYYFHSPYEPQQPYNPISGVVFRHEFEGDKVRLKYGSLGTARDVSTSEKKTRVVFHKVRRMIFQLLSSRDGVRFFSQAVTTGDVSLSPDILPDTPFLLHLSLSHSDYLHHAEQKMITYAQTALCLSHFCNSCEPKEREERLKLLKQFSALFQLGENGSFLLPG